MCIRDRVTSFGLWVNAVDNEYFEGDTVEGSIWYDNITAIRTDSETAVFADPEQPVHAHEYVYADNGDRTHTKKCECGEELTEDHILEDGVCICGAIEKTEFTAPKAERCV